MRTFCATCASRSNSLAFGCLGGGAWIIFPIAATTAGVNSRVDYKNKT